MKFKRKMFKRKTTQNLEQVLSTVGLATAHSVLAELYKHPITVKHDIHRRVPRPTSAIIVAQNMRGEQYRQMIDMTWKHTMIVSFPLVHFTGRPEDNGIWLDLHLILEYDPKDR